MLIAAGAGILAACGAESGSSGHSVLAGLNFWRISNQAIKTYPDKTPYEARKQYAKDKFNEAAATMSDEQKRALAASFYLGYSSLNGRAIPDYCAQMRVDISAFADGFKKKNRREEASLEALLEAEGLTRDDVWEKQKRFAMAAAKNELLNAGGLKGSYSVCSDVEDHPERYLAQASFARQFPQISWALNNG